MSMIRFALLVAALFAAVACGGGGVGSGGTGITVGNGGVGSGGTGIVVGPITGFGSIIVNGIEFNIDGASLELEDASTLKLGMTVEIEGSIVADFATGTATRVVSFADLRGTAGNISAGAGTFDIFGTSVTTDEATIFDGVAGVAALAAGDVVQVYGLIYGPQSVRATRVELLPLAAPPVVSGTVTNLSLGSSSFSLGNLTVNYAGAAFLGGLSQSQLNNGMQVRVRANSAPSGGVLQATQVQLWHAALQGSSQEPKLANLGGSVTNFASLSSFVVLGTPVDASLAQISGGAGSSIGNGVKVEVAGTLSNGVLAATKVKVIHIPGTGGPSSFQIAGTVGAFVSPADFRVNGNPINAGAPSVNFIGGTAADLRNGRRVQVVGRQVVDGVLIADTVTIEP